MTFSREPRGLHDVSNDTVKDAQSTDSRRHSRLRDSESAATVSGPHNRVCRNHFVPVNSRYVPVSPLDPFAASLYVNLEKKSRQTAGKVDSAQHPNKIQPSAHDFVDAASTQTCGMPKRPLGHGEASDAYPVPPVGRFGATCAVALTPSAPTPTPTSIQTGSASEIVSDGASLELLEAQHNQSDSRGPHDCTHTASGEPSLRGAHSRTPAHEYSTLKESSPPQTSGPPSSDSGP
jgi:hypothetical protein